MLPCRENLCILFPVCLTGHWVAVDADLSTRHIKIFDSLNSSRAISKPLAMEITQILNGIHQEPTARTPWTFYLHPYPQQLDNFSCGVATISAIHQAAHPDSKTDLWNPQKPGLTRMSYYRLCMDSTLPEVPDSISN